MASKTLKVRATQLCYVGHKLRREGDVFQVQTGLFSPSCMEILSGEITKEQVARFKAKGFEDKSLKLKQSEAEPEEEVAGDDPKEPSGASASDADVI